MQIRDVQCGDSQELPNHKLPLGIPLDLGKNALTDLS